MLNVKVVDLVVSVAAAVAVISVVAVVSVVAVISVVAEQVGKQVIHLPKLCNSTPCRNDMIHTLISKIAASTCNQTEKD